MNIDGLNTYLKSFIADVVAKGHYVKPTGSRVTESGWTEKSDYDFVVLDKEKTLAHYLARHRHAAEGGSGNGSEFTSYKIYSDSSSVLNLILVDSQEVFMKYCVATEIIKTLNTKTKAERIKVFGTVFGKTVEGVPF